MNDIEKKLRKRALQKLDKYAHNPYHVNKPSFFSRIPLWGKIAVPASLVTAVAVVAFVGLINGVSKGNAAPAPGKNDGASYMHQQSKIPVMIRVTLVIQVYLVPLKSNLSASTVLITPL
jgi:hypothetical protein